MIEIKNLSFGFSPNAPLVLHNINLKIENGDFVAVLGPNGSGKSTFARMLNGLLQPQEGTVLVDGLDTGDRDALWEIRRKVGLVFQNPENQIVAATVEDDVAFGPENLGLSPEEIKERVTYALQSVRMTEERETAPHLLSGGQKARVAIAGILAMKPDYIVFDEPTAMLDPKGRKLLLEEISELNHKDKITVIYITHNMEEAALADRIIALKNGELAYDDAPKRLFSNEHFLQDLGLELPCYLKLSSALSEKGICLPLTLTEADVVDGLKQAYSG